MSKVIATTPSKDDETMTNDDTYLEEMKEITPDIPDEGFKMMSVETRAEICKMHKAGAPDYLITKLVNHSILCGKIKKAIKDENFHQVVHPVGRDKYMYVKFVQVDDYQSTVDEKKFNSERACRQWLKMKKIRGLI